MNSFWFDFIAMTLMLINLALNWRFGIIGRAIALDGLYDSMAAATALGNGLLRFFDDDDAANDLYNNAWTFIGITFGVVFMVEILGALYRDRVEKVISLMFDRTSGMIAGVIINILEINVVIMVAFAVDEAQSNALQQTPKKHQDATNAVRSSVITSHIAGLNPAMQTFFGPALPSSLSEHLIDPTAQSTPTPRP